MTNPTDIRVIGTELYFLPVQTRVPLKFGPETLTSVTCARACVRVRDRQGREAVAADTRCVAERLPHRLAQYQTEVFGSVVPVDFDVAFGTDGEIERTVARDLLDHVRQEGQRRLHTALSGAIETDFDPNACLARGPLHPRLASGYRRSSIFHLPASSTSSTVPPAA